MTARKPGVQSAYAPGICVKLPLPASEATFRTAFAFMDLRPGIVIDSNPFAGECGGCGLPGPRVRKWE